LEIESYWRFILKAVLLSVALIAASVVPATAATIVPYATEATVSFVRPEGGTVFAPQSGVGDDREAIFPTINTENDRHLGKAVQRSDGYSTVELASSSASAVPGQWKGVARAVNNYTVTNDNFILFDTPRFNFEVNGLYALIDAGYGADDNPFEQGGEMSANPGFLMSYIIWIDSVIAFEAKYEAYGYATDNSDGLLLKESENLNMKATITALKYGGTTFTYGYEIEFAPLFGSLPIGLLTPGASSTVRTSMTVKSILATNEAQVVVEMGDPSDVGPFLSTAAPSPVPLPAGGLLLIGALGGLAALRRRKTV
jgi:hypothetical protein